MKSKAKSKICPLTERTRKRISLSIDPDHHAFIKDAGLNASRFFDTAINALKTNISISELQITTFTSSDGQIDAIKESRRRELNPRPADYESLGLISAIGEKFDNIRGSEYMENFSGPRGNSEIPFTLEGEDRITHARRIRDQPITYFFDLESVLYFTHIVKPDLRPASRKGLKGHIIQLLKAGKITRQETGKSNVWVALDSEITYETIQEHGQVLKGSKSTAPAAGIRDFLKYWSTRWNDITLEKWASSIERPSTKDQDRAAFAFEGEKADIDHEKIRSDIGLYYSWIIDVNAETATYRYQQNPPAFRNLVTVLFGITTGIRSEEMNRLTWEDLNDYKDARKITFDQGKTVTKPEGSFILTGDKSKTNLSRVIPIHPQIRPYLDYLENLYPDKPFSPPSFTDARKNAGAQLQIRQFRNFSAKYFRDYGIDEFYRTAIMGHDEGVMRSRMEQTGAEETSKGVSALYGKFSPSDITEKYMETVGTKFNPIPAGISLPEMKKILNRAPPTTRKSKKAPASQKKPAGKKSPTPASQGTPGRATA